MQRKLSKEILNLHCKGDNFKNNSFFTHFNFSNSLVFIVMQIIFGILWNNTLNRYSTKSKSVLTEINHSRLYAKHLIFAI